MPEIYSPFISEFNGADDAADGRGKLGLIIGTDVQAYSANLDTFAGIAPSANVQTLLGSADYSAFRTSLSLGNVENTALSAWAGTTNITTLGTVGTGVWNGTAIGDSYISSASTWNGYGTSKANLSGATFTGAVLHPAGSAASPSLAFSGDSNTGLYNTAADTLSVAIAGAEKIRFDANGMSMPNGGSGNLYGTGWPGWNSYVANDGLGQGGYNLFYRAGGSHSVPTNAKSGMNLGLFGFRGYDGSGWESYDSAQIVSVATEDHDATHQGSRIDFSSKATGTNTLVKCLSIQSNIATFTGAMSISAAIADSAAPTDSLFKGSDHSNKWCIKDSGGTVHELW